jgi:glycosyltransferase involved in cell wall biosynthesis
LPLKVHLLRRAYRQADRVIAVSQALRRAAIAYYGLAEDRVLAVANPLDSERIDRLAASADPPLEPDRFHVVAAGRLQEQKGFRYLIAAVDRLVRTDGCRSVLLRILGTGSQEGALRADVASRGLAPYVRFEGYVSNPFGYFRKAHLFCLSSIYEGMPNVLLEAMLCRTPLVATDCPTGPREILAGGRFGRLVPPADADRLADAIRDAIERPEAWRAVAEAGRKHVLEHHGLPSAARQLEELLLSARHGAPPRPG